MNAIIRDLLNNKTFSRYLKNTSWLLAERVVKIILGFFVIALLVRYLGPKNYGIYSYSQSFVALFIAFSTLGMEVILTRELSKNREQSGVILGTALSIKFIASVLAIFLIMMINFYIGDESTSLSINIIAFTLIFQSVNLGMDTYFQANVLSKNSAIANTIAYTFSALIKIGLIYLEKDLIYFIYALVFDAALIFFAYIYLYKIQGKTVLFLKYDRVMASYLLKQSLPMIMVAMAVFLYTKVDQIMIKHLISEEEVGYYAAATRISEVFYFIPLLITQSIFPKIVEERKSGLTKEYFHILSNIYKIVFWTSIPIVCLVFIFRGSIVEILFGVNFSESANILSVLIYCLVLVSVGSVNTKILYAENYERKYLKRSVIGMFLNIGLNFFLIPVYSGIGAAISTLITLFIIYYLFDLFDKDLRKFSYLKFTPIFPNLK
jgi:O-antigen/teichoic acid export membrane protein